MSTSQITPADFIKGAAQRASFDLCGITTPTLPNKYYKKFNSWHKQGFYADMEYMKQFRDRRTNPELVLPGVQSVIALAINYFQDDSESSPKQLRVAKYARGKDYHNIIEEYQKTLLTELKQEFPDHKWKKTVDYGHVFERAYAEQAGIGFIGKNSNLITREYGSYVFLSTILTTLKLEPDTPAGTRLGKCGTCTRCIQACPNKAITSPATIDANKCISYWTIENKTEKIPKSIAKNTKGYGYGCDLCQLACPHNIRTKTTHHEQLLANNGVGELLPLNAGNMTEKEFKNHYDHTPLRRASAKGIKRNTEAISGSIATP